MPKVNAIIIKLIEIVKKRIFLFKIIINRIRKENRNLLYRNLIKGILLYFISAFSIIFFNIII